MKMFVMLRRPPLIHLQQIDSTDLQFTVMLDSMAADSSLHDVTSGSSYACALQAGVIPFVGRPIIKKKLHLKMMNLLKKQLKL